MDFTNRVALVTGGSSGIGLATARLLAAKGAHVWLIARDECKLAAALAQVRAAQANGSQKCGIMPADVASAEQSAAAVAHVAEKVGLPDLVINSAGVVRPGYFQELDLELFRWMMDVNYLGTVYVTHAVVPGMIARKSGHIVNIASAAALLPSYTYTAYAASKWAVRGFSGALRTEMKPLGIRVSLVFPWDTDTPQLAYENQFKPPETKELAGTVRPMSADTVAEAIVTGVSRGHYTIIPGFEPKLIFRLRAILGSAPVVDFLISRARRRHGR
jgi:3-dehydrosphinganine reductase